MSLLEAFAWGTLGGLVGALLLGVLPEASVAVRQGLALKLTPARILAVTLIWVMFAMLGGTMSALVMGGTDGQVLAAVLVGFAVASLLVAMSRAFSDVPGQMNVGDGSAEP